MSETAESFVEPSLETKLKKSLKDISTYVDDASEQQKRKLWLLLEDVQTPDESKVNAHLKNLLDDSAGYSCVDNASEDQKRKLLLLLQDVRASDRREHPRKSCFIEVSYTIQNRTFTDLVRNISAGGVFIITSEPLFLKQQLPLAFSYPNREKPLRMMGQVVWKGPVGVGVQFTSPPRQELMELIETL
jgi:Tfp pilus assembly protein PilZ